jgi:hypothetical protein
MIQLIIATVLLFVLFFGIGFILNMLMKTTWFPVYGYILLAIGLLIYWSQQSESPSGNWLAGLAGYSWADYTTAVGGLIGAILSGFAIRTLRAKGFKMF